MRRLARTRAIRLLFLGAVVAVLIAGVPAFGEEVQEEIREQEGSQAPQTEDAASYFRLAQGYGALGKPGEGLEAIERAVALEPENIEYLQTRAQLANWAGRYDVAVESYERLLALGAGDEELILTMARSRSWGGDLTGAVGEYEAFLDSHPERVDVLIEYARVKAWLGDYAASLEILGRYREAAGETPEYRKERARVLAWAGRPRGSLAELDTLPERERNEYGVSYTRTIALHNGERHREALASLDRAAEQCPDCKETGDLRLLVGRPLRSYARAGGWLYLDSDDLSHLHTELRGVLVYRPETRFHVEVHGDFLSADRGSGLENVDGDEDANHQQVLVGVSHRFSLVLAGSIAAGVAVADGQGKFPVYDVELTFRPRDELKISLSREYGYYVLSPRTVSLEIRRGMNRATLEWLPSLRYTVIASLGLDTFSDDNTRWEAVIAPRRSMLRTGRLSLDVGLNGTWFGFEDDPVHGYYAPETYQRYMVTSSGYWNLSDDHGAGFSLAGGIQKDDDMDDVKFGWSVEVNGTFGIFADWMFEVRGAVMENLRQTAGAFRGYRLEGFITRRFGASGGVQKLAPQPGG